MKIIYLFSFFTICNTQYFYIANDILGIIRISYIYRLLYFKLLLMLLPTEMIGKYILYSKNRRVATFYVILIKIFKLLY